jgi:hypothetical protein
VLSFFAPLLLGLLALSCSRRFSLTELALFLAFAVLGCTARRHGIWFALIVTPMLARHLAGLHIPQRLRGLRHRRQARPQLRRSPQRAAAGRIPRALNWLILTCLLLVTVALSPWVRPQLGLQRLRPQLLDESTPIEAVDYIAEHRLVGHIFHPQAYGDYLIWRLWPQQRSFIDGRVHLFPASFLVEYLRVFQGEGWESRLARYDIQYLLLPKDDQQASSVIEDAGASPNWTVLHEDDKAILFRKQP